MEGESTELDKTIIEKISDPLMHLASSSLDHGIETPEERVLLERALKAKLSYGHSTGKTIIIEIEDDGRGIDF